MRDYVACDGKGDLCQVMRIRRIDGRRDAGMTCANKDRADARQDERSRESIAMVAPTWRRIESGEIHFVS